MTFMKGKPEILPLKYLRPLPELFYLLECCWRTGVTRPVGISLKYVSAYVFPMQPAGLPNISVRFSNIKNLNLKIYSSQM